MKQRLVIADINIVVVFQDRVIKLQTTMFLSCSSYAIVQSRETPTPTSTPEQHLPHVASLSSSLPLSFTLHFLTLTDTVPPITQLQSTSPPLLEPTRPPIDFPRTWIGCNLVLSANLDPNPTIILVPTTRSLITSCL